MGSICTAGNAPPSENSSILDQAFMLAMHDTDYDLPKGRSVTVRRAVDVNMLDFNSAVAIMDAGYARCDGGHARRYWNAFPNAGRPNVTPSDARSSVPNGRRCGSATISWRGWPKRRSLTSATS